MCQVKMREFPTKLFIYTAFLFCSLAFSVNVGAAEIQEILRGNITVNADYRPGDQSLPAVLILHGFMTTHHFNLVQIIANELAEQQYSVLAPTLSLNINDRKAGLDCEAIHTHNMQDDLSEIGWWIHWLRQKGHQKIILVGHSTGSMQLAAYAVGAENAKQGMENVTKLILTAPAYYSGYPLDEGHLQEESQRARKLLKSGSNELAKYHVSYCKGNYTTTAAAYLSYMTWTNEKLVNTFKSIKTPMIIILGEMDYRYGKDWAKRLNANRLSVKIVKGANHFFDSPYEFDFLDILLGQLRME